MSEPECMGNDYWVGWLRHQAEIAECGSLATQYDSIADVIERQDRKIDDLRRQLAVFEEALDKAYDIMETHGVRTP